MKVFISYAGDGGLDYAKEARPVFTAGGHDSYMWEHSRALGTLPWEEISVSVIGSDTVFYICTSRSPDSYGQRLEVSYAMNNRIPILAIRVDSAALPPVLTAFTHATWQSHEFTVKCGDLASHLAEVLARIKHIDPTEIATQKLDPIANRNAHIVALNKRTSALLSGRAEQLRQDTLQAYLEGTIAQRVARTAQQIGDNTSGFVTIELWTRVSLEDFNGTNWEWRPFFTDLGRRLNSEEEKYLMEVIIGQIKGEEGTISREEPDFASLVQRIYLLEKTGMEPNIILAPVDMLPAFYKHFRSNLDWSIHPERLTLLQSQLSIFWSNRFAPSDAFIVCNSNAGTWMIIPDEITGHAITVGIGQSSLYPDKVEVGAETKVKYEINNPEAFCIVRL